MEKFFKNIFLFLALLVCTLDGTAQLYPVQLTPVFNIPYAVKISDYANSIDTKMQLLISPTDISILHRQVRLKFYIQGNGINVQSSDYIQGQRPIFINGGELQTLTNTDIAALFRLENLQGISAAQYAGALPEGMYNFCFELYDFVTNQKLSQKSCAMMYLQLNDPPLLNIPAKNEQIIATDFPNILFTWTPRQINATNVSYKFELKQLIDPTLDPQFAFQMSPLLHEETLYSTALLYNLSMPILIPGMRYAWRVKAISTTGLSENSIFKNDGYSEIFSFKYASNCAAPTFLLSQAQSPKSARITWQSQIENKKFHIQYRTKGVANAQWFSVYTQNNQVVLANLEPESGYEFRVGATCDVEQYGFEQSYVYSSIQEFKMPAKQNTDQAYNCGIRPTININNQKPLTNLIQSETFTAGDFPVTILELQGHGPYSGKGYIIVPYLADTKIAVDFNNITINTDYQLIGGVVETSYNPDWKNVVDIDKLVDDVKEIISDFPEINIFSPNETIPQKDISNKPDDTNSIVVNDSNTSSSSTIPTENNSQGNTSNASNNNSSSPNSNNSTASNTNTNVSNNTADNTAPIPEKVKFESATLTACDTKTKKRIAKEGETLYYVNTSSSKIDKTDILLTINQKLTKEKIKDNVHWFSNNTVIDNSDGLLKFTTKDLDKDATIKSVAGFPTENTKSVDIKFVNKTAIAWSFVPPAVSQTLTKTFEEVDGNLKKMDKYIKISNFLKFKIDPIKINGAKYNEEDVNSRYYKKMEVGSVSGGFSVESPEKLITIPALQALSRAGIVDIGLYFKASFGVDVEGGVERYILAEQTNYKNNNPFLKIGPKGSITAGIKAELLIAKEQVQFDVRGGIEAGLKGDVTYDFSTKKLVGEIYFPPVILFANVHIETKGFVEFELVDFQKSIEITDKIPFYEYNKQF